MGRYPLAPEFAKLELLSDVPHSRLFLQLSQAMPHARCRSQPGLAVEQHNVVGWRGKNVRTWLIKPATASGPLPCVIYFHGGGFMMHIQPYMFGMARSWARELGCIVIVPEYHLAPASPFPAAAEDAYAAYTWANSRAAALGIQRTRIAVAGDSAGGNLAAAACLMARDRELEPPCFHMLLYPACDRRLITDSCARLTDAPVWNTPLSKLMWEYYLGTSDEAEIRRMEGLAYASPLEAKNHAGLPDAYVEVCEFDSLRDEGLAYAEALRAAGSSVEVHEIAGAPHGPDLAGHAGPIMREVTRWRLDALRRAL